MPTRSLGPIIVAAGTASVTAVAVLCGAHLVNPGQQRTHCGNGHVRQTFFHPRFGNSRLMITESPVHAKAALRIAAHERRLQHRAQDEPRRAADHFIAHVPLVRGQCVALYTPIKGELDPRPLYDHCARLSVVSFNVPTGSQSPLPREQPDLVVVPFLLVDPCGYRLGYGGGYYDRWIRALRRLNQPTPRVIGYGYDFQRIADRLPREDTDEQLDGLVTEQGYWDFRA